MLRHLLRYLILNYSYSILKLFTFLISLSKHVPGVPYEDVNRTTIEIP